MYITSKQSKQQWFNNSTPCPTSPQPQPQPQSQHWKEQEFQVNICLRLLGISITFCWTSIIVGFHKLQILSKVQNLFMFLFPTCSRLPNTKLKSFGFCWYSPIYFSFNQFLIHCFLLMVWYCIVRWSVAYVFDEDSYFVCLVIDVIAVVAFTSS